MVQRYCSFLVRCWHLANGDRRVRVEHVQTGEVLNAASLDAALAWMDARADAALEGAPIDGPSALSAGQGTSELPAKSDDV